MSGERTPDTTPPARQGSSDDDISLREHMQRQIEAQRFYFERVIDDLKDLLGEREVARTKALEKLERDTQVRFESVNEFRGQQADVITRFMPRAEAEVRIGALADRFEAQADRLNKLELRISSRLDVNEGRSSGLDKAWGYIIGAVGMAGAIVAIVIATR